MPTITRKIELTLCTEGLSEEQQKELEKITETVSEFNGLFDQMATERALMMSREDALINKKLAKKLTYWLIGLTAAYIFVYVMGRRRLVRKIWARNRQLKDALAQAEESDRMKTAFIIRFALR